MNLFIRFKQFERCSFSDTFANLPNLHLIVFNTNKFTTVKAFQFAGIANPGVEISFNYNEISTVEPNAFDGKNVVNSASKIVKKSISGTMNGFIFFYDNKIQTLDSDWLQPILDNGNYVDVSSKKQENTKTIFFHSF